MKIMRAVVIGFAAMLGLAFVLAEGGFALLGWSGLALAVPRRGHEHSGEPTRLDCQHCGRHQHPRRDRGRIYGATPRAQIDKAVRIRPTI